MPERYEVGKSLTWFGLGLIVASLDCLFANALECAMVLSAAGVITSLWARYLLGFGPEPGETR